MKERERESLSGYKYRVLRGVTWDRLKSCVLLQQQGKGPVWIHAIILLHIPGDSQSVLLMVSSTVFPCVHTDNILNLALQSCVNNERAEAKQCCSSSISIFQGEKLCRT